LRSHCQKKPTCNNLFPFLDFRFTIFSAFRPRYQVFPPDSVVGNTRFVGYLLFFLSNRVFFGVLLVVFPFPKVLLLCLSRPRRPFFLFLLMEFFFFFLFLFSVLSHLLPRCSSRFFPGWGVEAQYLSVFLMAPHPVPGRFFFCSHFFNPTFAAMSWSHFRRVLPFAVFRESVGLCAEACFSV